MSACGHFLKNVRAVLWTSLDNPDNSGHFDIRRAILVRAGVTREWLI
jgi:hypothetical protein